MMCMSESSIIPVLTGCPQIVRSDRGTENCVLAACHMALRHSHNDTFAGDRAYRYGKSTSNTVGIFVVELTLFFRW